MTVAHVQLLPIEPADEDDVLRLFRGERSTWPSGGGQIWWRYWHWQRDREFWVKAVCCGRLTGFAHWTVRRRDTVRVLHDIIVGQEFRGMGLGRLLVAHIGEPIVLKTDTGGPAEVFYQRLGFTRGKTRWTKNGKKQVTEYSRGLLD